MFEPPWCNCTGSERNVSPTFEIVFVLACHYAISKLCKGKCHHYGQRGLARVPTSPHVHTGFDHMGTSAAAGTCVLPQTSPTPTAARSIAHFESAPARLTSHVSHPGARTRDRSPDAAGRLGSLAPVAGGQARRLARDTRAALVSMYNATIVDSRHIAYAKTKRATFK